MLLVSAIFCCAQGRRSYSGPRIIIVEGLIGSGKTTFIRSLEAYFRREFGISAYVFNEDIDADFLAAYLGNQSAYAFAFQSNLALSRRYQWEAAKLNLRHEPDAVVILDRSRIGDMAFALLLLKTGKMSDADFLLYNKISLGPDRTPLEQIYTADACRLIHLDVTPKTSFERMNGRHVKCEVDGYKIAYMSNLRDAYAAVLETYAEITTTLDWNDPITVVDGAIPPSVFDPIARQLKF